MDHFVSSPLRPSRLVVGVCLLGLAVVMLAPCMYAARAVTTAYTETENQTKHHHKESKRADTREIEAVETQWRDAMVKGDTVSLGKLLSDDFFGISSNGTVSDKQQELHRMSAKQSQFTSIELMDQKVRMQQTTTAIVVSQAHVLGQIDGRPVNGVFRYTKVYGRENGAWRVLNFEATRVSGEHSGESDMRRGTPIAATAPAH
jgi:ketosteroid isomerase-like protein